MSQHVVLFRNAFFYASLVVALFPILPLRWAAYVIIVWGACALLVSMTEGKRNWKQHLGLLLLFTSVFILHSISYLVVDAPTGSYHFLERRLSLIVFPLGFYLNINGFSEKQNRQVLQMFELASLALVIYIAIDVVPQIVKHWHNIQAGTGFNWVYRNRVETITKIHPTYLSIILLFTIFLKLERFIRRELSQSLVFMLSEGFQVVLILTCCLFLSARGPLIAFAIAIVVFFFQINWKRTIIGVALGLPVLFILFSSVPAISSRFQELMELNRPMEEGESMNSTRIRQNIFQCSMDVLDEHWVWGVGLPRVQKELNECYERIGETEFVQMEYNTHNQFLHVWIAAGLLGILLFVASLIYPMILAYRHNDSIYLFFLVFFACCFLTENLLARQHGVVMFTFFNSLLAFSLVRKKH